MANPAGESNAEVLEVDFDRRLMLQFRGSVVTSDAGLLAYRELDAALGLTTMAGDILGDSRTRKNGRHALVGMLRLCSCDLPDTRTLPTPNACVTAMRWIVGGFGDSGIAEPNGP